MKQTAVEWLFEQIYGDTDHVISYTADEKNAIEAFKSKDAIEAFEKAKAMEREQIVQSFDMGFKLGVFWHIEITETKVGIDRHYGKDYYKHVIKGGEQ
jgi:hypothetical protein